MILELALKDAEAFPKAGKDIPDRREKTGTGLGVSPEGWGVWLESRGGGKDAR